MAVKRFLLDQNFPSPPFDPRALDGRVDYISLRDFDQSLTESQTPDWLIYLRAQEGRFAGFVTRDKAQLDQPEELVTIMRTDLSVITWRHPIEDSVQEWGQMIAYMPEVLDRLERHGPRIFLLPRPSLRKSNVIKATSLMGEYAKTQRRSQAELRREALEVMTDELSYRGLDRLAQQLAK